MVFLALICSHQLMSVAAVVARPNLEQDKNLPRRALMTANANQVLPAAEWTLALAGLHVVQAVSEGQLPVYICPQCQLFRPTATLTLQPLRAGAGISAMYTRIAFGKPVSKCYTP
jgi:hypothetical protein